MRMTRLYEELEIQDFVKEAAEAFKNNPKLSSYTSGDIKAGCLFALRFGLSNDCVIVFKLDEYFEPVNYQNIVESLIEKPTIEITDDDDNLPF